MMEEGIWLNVAFNLSLSRAFKEAFPYFDPFFSHHKGSEIIKTKIINISHSTFKGSIQKIMYFAFIFALY